MSSAEDSEKLLKIVAVGDDGVGKTSLLLSFVTNKFPREDQVTTTLDSYVTHMQVANDSHTLELWDTAGSEDYDSLRPLTYDGADMQLVIFSIDNRSSYRHARKKWISEIRMEGNGKFLLVGTKSDLTTKREVSKKEAKALAKKEGGIDYVEVSALEGKNLHVIFEIVVRHCKDLNHYEKEFMNYLAMEDLTAWGRTKVQVVGPSQSGKTSLVNSLLGSKETDTYPTFGISHHTAECHTSSNGVKWSEKRERVKLTSDLVTLGAVKKNFEKNSPNKKGNVLRRSVRKLRTSIGSSRNRRIPIATPEQASALFDQAMFINKLKECEDGVRSNTLEIFDFGGEEIFQSFSDFFLSPESISLLVFDMEKALSEKEKYIKQVAFWFQKVTMYKSSTKVVIIGTHHDQVKSKKNLATIDTLLSKGLKLDEESDLVVKINGRLFIPTNASDKTKKQSIRDNISKVVSENRFGIAGRAISIRWAKLLDDLGSVTKMPWVSSADANQVGKSLGIKDVEVDNALRYFNDCGLITYLEATDTLKSMIILDPEWISKQLGMVIRDRNTHSLAAKEMEKLKSLGYEKDLDELFRSGCATYNLLLSLWDDEESARFMVELMKHTLLLSEWKGSSGENTYLIPAAPSSKDGIEKGKGPTCSFSFADSSLPFGVFERLVCLCIDFSATQEKIKTPTVGRACARIWLGSADVICLEQKDDTISLVVENSTKLTPERYVSLIDTMLGKISDDFMDGMLEWKVKLSDGQAYKDGRRDSKLRDFWYDDVEATTNIPTKGVDLPSFVETLSTFFLAKA